MHLSRPFAGTFPITQEFGVQNNLEPEGFTYPDGGIGYVWKPGAIPGRPHNGTDYGLPCGTPLLAPAAGTVVFAGLDSTGFGNRISIDHGQGVQTLCGHLSQIGVTVGDKVSAGQLIGYSGTTGNSTGCHLHWSVRQDGEYVSPVPYLDAPVPHAQPQFKVVVEQWLRAKPDAASARLVDVPVGAIVTNWGAPTPSWLWVTYQGVHGWIMRDHVVPA